MIFTYIDFVQIHLQLLVRISSHDGHLFNTSGFHFHGLHAASITFSSFINCNSSRHIIRYFLRHSSDHHGVWWWLIHSNRNSIQYQNLLFVMPWLISRFRLEFIFAILPRSDWFAWSYTTWKKKKWIKLVFAIFIYLLEKNRFSI